MNLSKLLAPKALPFDFSEWKQAPFAQRVQMLCTTWATQGYGAPASAYVFYLLKIGLYVGMWLFFCSFSAKLGAVGEIATWWMEPEALLRFLVWSVLFEGVGLGCGSGPLTAASANSCRSSGGAVSGAFSQTCMMRKILPIQATISHTFLFIILMDCVGLRIC